MFCAIFKLAIPIQNTRLQFKWLPIDVNFLFPTLLNRFASIKNQNDIFNLLSISFIRSHSMISKTHVLGVIMAELLYLGNGTSW